MQSPHAGDTFGRSAFWRTGDAIKIGFRSAGASDEIADANVREESAEQARVDGTEVSADASDRLSESLFSRRSFRKAAPVFLGGEQGGDIVILRLAVASSKPLYAMTSI